MPSTLEAVEHFIEAKILYAPGKASNAGGVATSGLEMSQNAIRLGWTHAEVDERLHAIMKDIHANCVRYGTKEDGSVNYVDGANIAGFVKLLMQCLLKVFSKIEIKIRCISIGFLV